MRYFIIFLMVSTQSLFAGALVTRDTRAQRLNFRSHIYLYGESDKTLAQNIQAEINRVWNTNIPTVKLAGVFYTLNFQVSVSTVTENEVRSLAETNNTVGINFVRILPAPTPVISSSFMIGHSNSGVWLLSQKLGSSTTAAHEYGHSLGLSHPEGSTFQGPPRLMVTDFYTVDPQYQVNGKLDLRKRSVTALDVAELGLEKLTFNQKGQASLGDARTVFLFDQDGNIAN